MTMINKTLLLEENSKIISDRIIDKNQLEEK